MSKTSTTLITAQIMFQLGIPLVFWIWFGWKGGVTALILIQVLAAIIAVNKEKDDKA